MNRSLFASATQTWETPDDLFAALHAEFGFTVDVCAESETAKLPRHWSPSQSAWWEPWAGETCWMNPPYSEVSKWMAKALEASEAGATVVCLVPSRTDTRWWHDYAMKAEEIRFLRGRLKFGGAKNSAPFPSAVVVFSALSSDGKPARVLSPARRPVACGAGRNRGFDDSALGAESAVFESARTDGQSS